jgi:hypothetical protein
MVGDDFHAPGGHHGAPRAVAGRSSHSEEHSMHSPKSIVRRCRSGAVAAIAAAIVYGGVNVPSAEGQAATVSNPELDSVRAALEKYQDPIRAIHDGYLSTLGCITVPRAGAKGEVAYRPGSMGVHFLNPGAIGPVPDPAKPQVLLYEPDGDKLRLVGAEWFIPLATGVKARPVLFGQPFDGPMAGHHPIMPASMAHYDLHVWLFKANPYGVFSATNPDVGCGQYAYTTAEGPPKIVANPNQ